MQNKKTVINGVAKEVEKRMSGEGTGHDWWHVYRVWQMAKNIGKKEEADFFVIELSALLHDIADWKFNGGNFGTGPKEAAKLLSKFQVDEETIERVADIVRNISFKGAGEENKIKTLEGKVVQDADRLDAIGAIGIARAFAYGGHKGRAIFNPQGEVKHHDSFEEYKRGADSTLHHFYEKLLLLKDRMNTETAKEIAVSRHQYLEEYLERFYREWEGKA